MESMNLQLEKLKKSLQDFARGEFDSHFDYDRTKEWVAEITPLLPREPLSHEFLSDVLAPFPPENQAYTFELLAMVGRNEVETPALMHVQSPKNREDRLYSAFALAHLSNIRGFEELKMMAMERIAKPKDSNTVPYAWIVDFLQNDIPNSALAKQLLINLKNLHPTEFS